MAERRIRTIISAASRALEEQLDALRRRMLLLAADKLLRITVRVALESMKVCAGWLAKILCGLKQMEQ